jgi:mRNA-degrading endonuclease toxin of MazEF toxin-antitoxin module
MDCGDAFMIDDDDETKEHLHVVLTKPAADGEVITVPICTRHRWSEVLVCVEPGDHPFIEHSSIVAYRHARIRKCASIQRAIECGKARSKEHVSESLLARMQAGLLDSDFVANEVRAFFRDHQIAP